MLQVFYFIKEMSCKAEPVDAGVIPLPPAFDKLRLAAFRFNCLISQTIYPVLLF